MTNTTIQNCSNAATVTTNGASGGGILGATHNDAYTRIIRNCVNTGAITSTGDGTGGILGGNGAKTTSTLVIQNCVNTGTISGANYVGGIVGIAREADTTNSRISGCINEGNVTATGLGIGGIAGLSRFNIENCACMNSVEINGVAASTYGAIGVSISTNGGDPDGIPGYIAGCMGLDSVATNCYLGEEFTVTITSGVADIFADNANIYVWAWGGSTASGGEWYLATQAGANQITVVLPYDITGMKVARFDPNISPSWDSEWNTTGDITIVPGTYGYSATM